MLVEKIKEKHVSLVMSSGYSLTGFVQNEENGYLRLIGMDNSESIVKVDDISVAKIGSFEKKSLQTNYPAGIISDHVQDNDFSVVATHDGDDTYAKQTEFVRQTSRSER
jgi:hypothetical protein